ncbi:MAG: trypsin-like peptidase domain-containing protein [Candidatus Nanohaloarchaea archaeon]|nr:trypsin-like peptidase domain-containing protein [Candidatus Nanohaloarchaea archaeon]
MATGRRNLVLVLIAVLIGFQIGFILQMDSPFQPGQNTKDSLTDTDQVRGNTTIIERTINFNGTTARSKLYNAIFQKARDSVVAITTLTQRESGLVQVASGSGFIYDEKGRIVTNNHVISKGSQYEVRLLNGNVYDAKVIGTDPYTDLAVLDIDAEGLDPIELGNSSQLMVGQSVLAIGNPFGLSGSMTAGIVSQTNRLLPATQGFSIPNVIQTDAAINPGNSGGPLLNLQAEVIGVNTAIDTTASGFQGVGFAIPSNTVTRVVPELIRDGSYEHPWIGVEGRDITPAIANAMGLQEARGFLVIDVVSGSPADRAGLQGGNNPAVVRGMNVTLGGDVIVGIGGQPVRKINDILNFLAKDAEVGDTVSLTVIRDDQRRELSLTLAQRPDTGSQ